MSDTPYENGSNNYWYNDAPPQKKEKRSVLRVETKQGKEDTAKRN